MNEKPILIENTAGLPNEAGVLVTIRGTYRKIDPVPHLRSSAPAWRAGIVFPGEKRPAIWLELPRPEGEMDRLDGQEVILSGTFYPEQPLKEGDPPFASRMAGKWLYAVEVGH